MTRRLLGFLPCYNEADILAETLAFYSRLRIPIVFIDNGSTDGSTSIARRFADDPVVEHVSYPTRVYDLREMLETCLRRVARHEPAWVLHIDADHLYEPGEGFASLHDHVDAAEREGSNVIDFDEYVFLPTGQDDSSIPSVYERIKHYAYRQPAAAETAHGHQLRQPRLYRYQEGMNISRNGGHTVTYRGTDVRMHPVRGVLRHYMFRSIAQAQKKLRDRRARYSAAGKARGWHVQYDDWNIEDTSLFSRDSNALIKRVEGTRWRNDVVLNGRLVSRLGPAESLA